MRQRQAHIEKSSVEAELRQEQALAAGLMRGSSSEEMPVTTEIKQGRISEGGRCLLADAHHFKPEDIVTLLTERITGRLPSDRLPCAATCC